MSDVHRHRPDEQIDPLVREALSEAQPVEDNARFLARLRRRIEAEEAIRPTLRADAEQRRWPLLRWALGFATAGVVLAVAAVLWPTSPMTEATPPTLTPRERVAQLAAEHAGEAMVIEIDEARGSVLFVAAVGRPAAANGFDQALLTQPGSVTVHRPAPNSDSEITGWIRTRRVPSANSHT
jgi:hypothetical protein